MYNVKVGLVKPNIYLVRDGIVHFVEGFNSMTVRGRGTQPLLMMVITLFVGDPDDHPQRGKRHGHPLPVRRQPLMLVNS